MDIQRLIQLVGIGESEVLEFKADVTDLGKVVASFANTQGGMILVGVSDNGEILGLSGKKKIQEISDAFSAVVPAPDVKVSKFRVENKLLAIVEVKKGNHLFSYKHIVYIRVGKNNRPLSIHEVIEKAGEGLSLFFDELLSDAKTDSIDKGLVQSYLDRRESVRGVKKPKKIDEGLSIKLRILRKYEKKTGVTNGGLLFFGKSPQDWINVARVHLVRFVDSGMQQYSDQRIFEGSVWNIVEELEEYLRHNLKRPGGGTVGFKRVEKFEYPLDALREAILNAIVHRNYFDAGEIKIFIMPDRILIKNPGSFPPGVTPEAPEHRPRNPLLAQYFYDVGLVEKYGGGIEKMLSICNEKSNVSIKFDLHPTSTTVIFQKSSTYLPDNVDVLLLEKLGQGFFRTSELAAYVKLTRQAVIKRLNNLIKAGLVLREGSGAAVSYRLT
ncbi:MAG: RNA-binding domain-containing protein [Pseudomonadota bacterium]